MKENYRETDIEMVDQVEEGSGPHINAIQENNINQRNEPIQGEAYISPNYSPSEHHQEMVPPPPIYPENDTGFRENNNQQIQTLPYHTENYNDQSYESTYQTPPTLYQNAPPIQNGSIGNNPSDIHLDITNNNQQVYSPPSGRGFYPSSDWMSKINGTPTYLAPNAMVELAGDNPYNPYQNESSSSSDSDMDKPGSGKKVEEIKRSLCWKLLMWQLSTKISICCFVFNLIVLVTIIMVYFFVDREALYFIIPGVLLTINLCFYYLQILVCDTMRYLNSCKTMEATNKYFREIRQITPVINISAECYHYETRVVNRTTTGADGRTTQTTETQRIRVVTSNPGADFPFDSWTDITPDFDVTEDIEGKLFVKLHLAKTWDCADEYTQNCWKKFVEDFKKKHKDDDAHFDFSQQFKIRGLKSKMLSSTSNQKSLFWNVKSYLLASLFFLQYPYCVLFDMRCGEKLVTFTKRVKINQQ